MYKPVKGLCISSCSGVTGLALPSLCIKEVALLEGHKRQNANTKAGDGAALASTHIRVLVWESLMAWNQDTTAFSDYTSANIQEQPHDSSKSSS